MLLAFLMGFGASCVGVGVAFVVDAMAAAIADLEPRYDVEVLPWPVCLQTANKIYLHHSSFVRCGPVDALTSRKSGNYRLASLPHTLGPIELRPVDHFFTCKIATTQDLENMEMSHRLNDNVSHLILSSTTNRLRLIYIPS